MKEPLQPVVVPPLHDILDNKTTRRLVQEQHPAMQHRIGQSPVALMLRFDQVESPPRNATVNRRLVECGQLERPLRQRVDLFAIDADPVVRRGRSEAIAEFQIGRVTAGARIDDQIDPCRLDLDRQSVVVGMPPTAVQPDRAGIKDGIQIRVAQDGNAGIGERPAGDLYALSGGGKRLGWQTIRSEEPECFLPSTAGDLQQ